MPGAVIKSDGKSGKDDAAKWVDEILGDISKASACQQIALGAASGWVTGYLSMKVGKAVAIAVGGGIIVIQVAQHKGYIKIDWNKITRAADKVVDRIEKETTGQPSSKIDKLGRYVDRKLDQAERYVDQRLDRADRRSRRWFGALFNNGNNRGYDLQELHIFLVSFAASCALGWASG